MLWRNFFAGEEEKVFVASAGELKKILVSQTLRNEFHIFSWCLHTKLNLRSLHCQALEFMLKIRNRDEKFPFVPSSNFRFPNGSHKTIRITSTWHVMQFFTSSSHSLMNRRKLFVASWGSGKRVDILPLIRFSSPEANGFFLSHSTPHNIESNRLTSTLPWYFVIRIPWRETIVGWVPTRSSHTQSVRLLGDLSYWSQGLFSTRLQFHFWHSSASERRSRGREHCTSTRHLIIFIDNHLSCTFRLHLLW